MPLESHGININFCKSAGCSNFGIPVEQTSTKGPGAVNRYKIVANGKHEPAAYCPSCKISFQLKSNQGVYEETKRIAGETFGEPTCPVPTCKNHEVPLSTPDAYYAFGVTSAGSQRYRCRCCDKTFSVKRKGRSTIANHQKSSKNLEILECLVNKMPQRRICEKTKTSPVVLYGRIDFFYQQASAFLADRESKLSSLDIKRLEIGVDRQEYAINWARRKDKKNVVLTAIASADNITGYVFGMHPNFDPDAEPTLPSSKLMCFLMAYLPMPYFLL